MIETLNDGTRTLVVSYLAVRRGIGMIGLFLPIILGPIGWLVFDIPFQDNISSYYHTVLRDVFVGSMCGIGIFLFCYRGYDWIESWTANIGCVSAIGVALFPLDANSDPLIQKSVIRLSALSQRRSVLSDTRVLFALSLPDKEGDSARIGTACRRTQLCLSNQRHSDSRQHDSDGSLPISYSGRMESLVQ